MKKVFILISIFLSLSFSFAGLNQNTFESNDDMYTDSSNVVINENINDPLKEGTSSSTEGVEGLEENNKGDFQESTIDYIARWINYFLGILGLLVIILIIKDGIIIITASGDDNKQKESIKNLRNYIIALIIIGVSYLLANLIINFVVENSTK